jgi:serine/threonine-protein kinase HipA
LALAHSIDVYFADQRVGQLSLVDGRLTFCYSIDWLAQSRPLALSHSLPLRSESFDDHHCRPFFAGLLPEGNLRQLIAKQCQVSNKNDFALLNAIGGECAGAITFVPAGQSVTDLERGGVEWLDEQQLVDLLHELPRRPMLAGRDGIRLSLAGAQDKLPVVFDGQRIGLPKGAQPSTHILKPTISAVEDSVLNEGYCMALAHAMGLPTAKAMVLPVRDHRILLVTRYDRHKGGDGKYVRLHQEDFCQALGVVPEMKYQNEGGPDLKSCFDLLREATRPSAPQVLRLLDAVVFNALIGNHDAHAKNFSLVYGDAAPVLAPLYDVLSTAVYETLTPKMAMKLGSKYKYAEVHSRHWEQFMEDAGLSKAQTKKRIRDLAHSLPSVARQVEASPTFTGEPIVARIINLIDQRSQVTIQRLLENSDEAEK